MLDFVLNFMITSPIFSYHSWSPRKRLNLLYHIGYNIIELMIKEVAESYDDTEALVKSMTGFNKPYFDE